MPSLDSFGKMLMLLGLLLVILGAAFHFGAKFIGFGRLPGDIHFKGENFSFYFPIVSSLVLSVILTVILNILFRR